MKKILFVLIGTSALIVSLSTAYYFVVFLPKQANEELILSKQKLEYQKEKDADIKKVEQSKQIQNNIKENQKVVQDNWSRARAECVAISDKNSKSFDKLLESCQTQLCTDNLIANKELQLFGEGFIESCTQNRL